MCDITSAIDQATGRLVARRLVMAIESGRILECHPAHIGRLTDMVRGEMFDLAVAASEFLGTLIAIRDEIRRANESLLDV